MTIESPNKLRHRLDDFVDQARENERKLRRFQSFELRLIGHDSLFAMIKDVLYPVTARFRWDLVALILLDPEYEIQRILEDEGVDLDQHPTLMFAADSDDIEALYPASLFPAPGPYRGRRHASLFPVREKAPGSVMLLPLMRHGRLIGSLNIGSYDAERFSRQVRTDFFEHFSAIVAICLENACNLERLKRQGLTDTLTAINNRRFFDQRLEEEVELAWRNSDKLSCLLMDIDYFKRVNDSYGHQVGDQVLMGVAMLVRAQMRATDVLSRYGGEEFSALLAHTPETEALEVAERIRASIEQHDFTDTAGGLFRITISIGVATLHGSREAAGHLTETPFVQINDQKNSKKVGQILVGQADRALYKAKAEGRNQVVCMSELMAQVHESE
jgi:diguanylate cyclase (GGDEF)-like protein